MRNDEYATCVMFPYPSHFVYTHSTSYSFKSFILNRKFINYVEGNFVVRKNEKQLPIGKNQRSTFKVFLGG